MSFYLQTALEKKQNKSKTQTQYFKLFRGKPFWYWDISDAEHKRIYDATNGLCCFNHIIGLPEKEGRRLPMFPYEKLVIDALELRDGDINKEKHVWVKKATGLGITELALRYILYLILKDDKLKGTQVVIITGPKHDLAIGLIKRMKTMLATSPVLSKKFKPALRVEFDDKETVLEINGVYIEAFPSNTGLKAARGLPKVSFVLEDEADFFDKGSQLEARHIAERYIGKSKPYILLVSTPNAPRGLFETIEREAEDKTLYRRLFLDYTYGLPSKPGEQSIYSFEDIERAKASPSFEREYNLKYLGLIGNIFPPNKIQIAMNLGKELDPMRINLNTPKYVGVDPGFGRTTDGKGGSHFAFTVMQLGFSGRAEVLFSEEYEEPDFNQMVGVALQIINNFGNVEKVFVDGSNPEWIKAVKLELGERLDYLQEKEEIEKQGLDYIQWGPRIVPVNFGTEHKDLLTTAWRYVGQELVAIHPQFDKLITALRTARAVNMHLDKNATSFDDLLDSFRLALKGFKFLD